MSSKRNSQILFWLGIFGIVFYVVSPILFPGVPNIRQPELLPVYTLCVGLGQLLKGTELVRARLAQAEKEAEDGEPKGK